jgi:hypothetical protein
MRDECATREGQGRNIWQATTKLSSFGELLAEHCRAMTSETGISFDIKERALTTAFFDWVQVVGSQAAEPRRNTPDYFQFLIGSLLARLLAAHAVEAVPGIEEATARKSENAIAKWWPAGFALTTFCVGLVRKIVAQECDQIVTTSEKFGDIKMWQSFRENLVEEPSIAIAYFDVFMGLSPNWHNPSFFRERAAGRRQSAAN